MASIWARYLAEFLGTYLLAVVIACNVVVDSSSCLPLYVAGAVAALTYALYNVSGAHLNPAVSIAFGVVGKMSWKMVGIYLVLQSVAAALAAATFAETMRLAPQTTKSDEYSWLEAGLAEVLLSAMFCFVFLSVATAKSEKDRQHYGFAIGLALLAGAYAGGHITGSVLNPAISLGWGLAGWRSGGSLALGTAFAVLDLIGAAIAAILFKACHGDELGVQADHTLGHRVLAEAIGTFYLVFIVGLSIVRGTTGRAAEPMIALSAVLASMVFALGDISGAHFNPAVTLAIMTSSLSKVSYGADGPVYMAAQFAAGVLGAIVCSFIEHEKTIPLPWGRDFAWLAIAIAEALFTMLLAFVVLSVSADSAAQGNAPFALESTDGDYDAVRASSEYDHARLPVFQEYAGLAVGLAAITGGVSAGGISGAILNPALAAGIAFTRGGSDQLFQCLLYIGFELVGGVLAAQVLNLLRPSLHLGKAQGYSAA